MVHFEDESFFAPDEGECLIRPGVTNSVWGKIIFVSRDIFCQGSFADIKVVEFVMNRGDGSIALAGWIFDEENWRR